MPGVCAVLTADDVPGDNAFGLEHADQPVLASEFVRYEGEPVALVAADHPETARRAAARIRVDYEVLPAVTDPRRAMDADAPAGAPAGQPRPPPASCAAASEDRDRAGRRLARLRGRHAGPGLPRPGVRARRARPRTAASTCTSPPSGCTSTSGRSAWRSGMPAGEGAADALRRRRRVRRPRGPVGARARLPAGAAHRQAGEDVLQPRGVLLRPRAPAPGGMHLRVRRRARRHAASTRRPHVLLDGGAYASSTAGRRRQRRHAGRSARTASRTSPSTPTASTPTTRRAARCAASAACRPRFAYEALMDELADAVGHGPGGDPAAATACARATATSPARSSTPRRRSPSCCRSCATCRCRPSARTTPDLRALPGRGRQHHARRGRRPRRRLRGRPTRTSASPRASTTTRPPACGWR